jgi:hypothetical protein
LNIPSLDWFKRSALRAPLKVKLISFVGLLYYSEPLLLSENSASQGTNWSASDEFEQRSTEAVLLLYAGLGISNTRVFGLCIRSFNYLQYMFIRF